MHLNVRLGEQDRPSLLLMLGARPDGARELVVEDANRESKES